MRHTVVVLLGFAIAACSSSAKVVATVSTGPASTRSAPLIATTSSTDASTSSANGLTTTTSTTLADAAPSSATRGVEWFAAGKVSEQVASQVQGACHPNELACVSRILRQAGASAEAVSNYSDLGGAFLVGVPIDDPPTSLGVIFDPWKANSNYAYVMLGGIPTIQFIDDQLAILTSGLYQPYDRLRASYPNLASDSARAVFTSETRGGGKNTFMFLVPLIDGCRACGTGAAARITLGFDEVGWEVESEDLGPCAYDPKNATSTLPACPATTPIG